MISWAATLSSTKPVPPVKVAVVEAGAGVAASAVVEAADEVAAVADEVAAEEAGTAVIVAAVAAAIVAGNRLQPEE